MTSDRRNEYAYNGYLIEYSEDRINERSYIEQAKLIRALGGKDDRVEAKPF
jgi:hypothetical protein